MPVSLAERRREKGPAANSSTRTPRVHRTPADLDALVIKLLKESYQPLTAYDIVRYADACGSRMAPMQVYRVLDRLVAANEAQRVELLSAYLPVQGERRGFMICSTCHDVKSFTITQFLPSLSVHCGRAGFRMTCPVIELWGECTSCARSRPN